MFKSFCTPKFSPDIYLYERSSLSSTFLNVFGFLTCIYRLCCFVANLASRHHGQFLELEEYRLFQWGTFAVHHLPFALYVCRVLPVDSQPEPQVGHKQCVFARCHVGRDPSARELDIMDRAAPWNFMSYVSAFNYTEPCLGRTFGMPNSAKTCLDPSSYLCKQGLRPRHKIGFVKLTTPHFVPC